MQDTYLGCCRVNTWNQKGYKGRISGRLIDVPREVDLEVANRKLKFLGVSIDKLTPAQEEYLNKSAV